MSKSTLAGHSFMMSLDLKREGMLPGKHHYSEQAQNANDNEVQVDQVQHSLKTVHAATVSLAVTGIFF